MSERQPLRIIPLGGLGEFGLNCMVFERGDDVIAVDCGLMFPHDHMMGIDLVIPDLSYLRDLGPRFKGFVLTHGHEDHIGALPHVLKDFDVPVYATEFTARLLERKLEEHPALSKQRVEEYRPGEVFTIGGFEIEGIAVTHSIIDACSLAIRNGDELLIHTGDFKLDPHPVDGRCTNVERFKQLGAEGVTVLLSDSTNIESNGESGSESAVRTYLEPLFERAAGRVFVTTFASHIHRVAAVVSLCEQFGRKLAIWGRSMEANAALATRCGHLRIPGEMLISADQAAQLAPEELCYLVTGSQGEARSALSRIALQQIASIRAEPGDMVIFSSKIIPGNERAIGAVIDQLFRCGVEVYYPRLMPLHVSGHAYSGELRAMLDMVKPRFFVPVHGEYRNLVHHGRLAEESGVVPERCFRLVNGDVLEVEAEACRRAGTVEVGRVYVDGTVVGGIGDEIIRDRRHISEDGMVIVVLGVSRQTGEIVSGPDLIARGLVSSESEGVDLEGARKAVLARVAQMTRAAVADKEELQEEVRLAARRFLRRATGGRPVVVPYVLEL